MINTVFEVKGSFACNATFNPSIELYLDDFAECNSEDQVVDMIHEMLADEVYKYTNKYDSHMDITVDEIYDELLDEDTINDFLEAWRDYKNDGEELMEDDE